MLTQTALTRFETITVIETVIILAKLKPSREVVPWFLTDPVKY